MTTCSECRFSVGMCRCERFRTYIGAKFADEPVDGDHHRTYSTLRDAKAGVREAYRGGFSFIHDTSTGEWFVSHSAGDWQALPPLGASLTAKSSAVANAEQELHASKITAILNEHINIYYVGDPDFPADQEAAISGVEEAAQRISAIIAALAAAPTIPATGEAIPAGMKPWRGGTKPDDWSGEAVMFRDGDIRYAPVGAIWKLGWGHSYGKGDIIAYTPKATIPATGHAATEGEDS